MQYSKYINRRTYCPQRISGEANEDTQLTISYARLHEHDEQIFQTFDQFDAELIITQGGVFQTNIVFGKNPSLLKKIIPFGPSDEGMFLFVEIQIHYDRDAHSFFPR